MVDITHKKNSLRIATASAIVQCGSAATIKAVVDKTVPKGDVLEMAKTAGLFAVKRTHDMIPDCHPIPVEGTEISYHIKDKSIEISITVKAIYRTGMEVEAMHGASVVALTMYDMLKPIDKEIEIRNIKLVKKSGGKSDMHAIIPKNLTAAILSIGLDKENKVGHIIEEKLSQHPVTLSSNEVIEFGKNILQEKIKSLVKDKVNLIFVLGGTGLSETDQSSEIIREILDKEITALNTQMITYGLERTFKAMVSQPLAGLIDKTIVLNLPGSSKGVADAYNAIMPEALYLFKSINYKA